jgi:hypothetical protein
MSNTKESINGGESHEEDESGLRDGGMKNYNSSLQFSDNTSLVVWRVGGGDRGELVIVWYSVFVVYFIIIME